MKIRTFKSLENGVYRVVLRTEDWSQGDQTLIAKYGEPLVNIGGDLSSSYSGEDFLLDDRYVGVLSESPFSQSFDSRDYDDAEERAATWAGYVALAIRNAVVDLRTNSDGFTTESVETV